MRVRGEDVKRRINATHILQKFILMGVLVGKGYSLEKAYETVEEWERAGKSKFLQQSKNMKKDLLNEDPFSVPIILSYVNCRCKN